MASCKSSNGTLLMFLMGGSRAVGGRMTGVGVITGSGGQRNRSPLGGAHRSTNANVLLMYSTPKLLAATS